VTYKTAWFCSGCDGELSDRQRMYSYGRCPLCGFKDGRSVTIVKTTEKAYRLERLHPWWKFWKAEKFRRVFDETESEPMCKCGHSENQHDDYDFNPHECQFCDCQQFCEAEDKR